MQSLRTRSCAASSSGQSRRTSAPCRASYTARRGYFSADVLNNTARHAWVHRLRLAWPAVPG
eukprot:8304339-Lingulodinium_polyedra.AAC.1